jgi:hypothetical protein
MSLFDWIKSIGRKKPADCYLGGKPVLPPGIDIPLCKCCGARQTFFFHLKLASIQKFSTKALSVFACTACSTPENLIPEMPPAPLKGAAISSEYLTRYQTNFRALVFEAGEGVVVDSYEETILYREIELDAEGILRVDYERIGKMGGAPVWLIGNETPGLCDGKYKFQFLFQIYEGCEFKTKLSAPRQIGLGLSGEPEPSGDPYYEIFIGDAFYAFGVNVNNESLMYFIPQV